MDDIISALSAGRVLVADGAMGTMLQDAGLPRGMPPEAWLLENPGPVQRCTRPTWKRERI